MKYVWNEITKENQKRSRKVNFNEKWENEIDKRKIKKKRRQLLRNFKRKLKIFIIEENLNINQMINTSCGKDNLSPNV